MQEVHFKPFEKFFFSLVSILFHPIFIPTYLLMIVFHLFSRLFIFNSSYLIAIITAYFILTALIPIIILSLFYYFKFISSFYLKTKEERILVSFAMTFFYFLTFYFMQNVYIQPQIFLVITILPILGILFSLIIIFYPNISMHTFGIGSLIGVIMFYKLYYLLFPSVFLTSALLLISGIVITARVALNAHSFANALIGFFGGIIASLGSIFLINI